jgi:pyruvate dehydrogenase E2 component (dihydrolipoamide acetyltransferase)
MPTSVVMPALEMAQETGKLISWLKKEGEAVMKGEPLLEIETDKAVMEVESPADGVLAGVKAEAGAEIQVGRTIAWIVKPGEAAPAQEEQAMDAESGRKFGDTSSQVSAQSRGANLHSMEPGAGSMWTRNLGHPSTGASGSSAVPTAGEIKISPKARRLAKEKGVNLSQVIGSGASGEILAADIEAAAGIGSSTAARPGVSAPHGLSAIARLMAERTAESWTTVPHFFVTREVDATALNEARQGFASAMEKSHQVKLTHSDLMVALVARVLARHPRMNASWVSQPSEDARRSISPGATGIRENLDINVSLAMAVGDGVVAPVIAMADKAELGAIAVQRRDLAERARGHRLRPADLAGGTFTISNLGMYEVDSFTAIITPPQAAILAVGRIADRVVAVNGEPAVRPMIALTLSVDHRVADGARAAEFMRDVADAIANPRKWLEKA